MARSRNSASGVIPNYYIGEPTKDKEWGGLNTAVKDNRFLARGETYDELNWIVGRDKDHIELRRGQQLVGKTRRYDSGKAVTGIGVGIRNDGVQVPYFTYARKILFYSVSLGDTFEVSTSNILPAAADGEDVSMSSYENIAGSYVYLSSPRSSIYKASVANPATVSDQGNDLTLAANQPGEVQNYKFGFIKINRGRMFGMNRNGQSQSSKDITGLYLSHVDKQAVTDFPNRLPDPPVPVFTPHTTGGTMVANTYYFVMTAVGPDGVETLQGPEQTVILGGVNTGSIDVSFLGIAGGTQYFLYGSTTSGVYASPSLVTIGGIYPVPSGPNTFTITNGTFSTGQPPSSTTQASVIDLGVGDGVQTVFASTLTSFVNPLTVFYLIITDGVETFTDDRSGNMVGSLGGFGTINYINGNYSVTFATAPASSVRITGSFYLEDATRGGVIDFVPNPSDTSNASAQVFRQDDGGGRAQAVFPFNGVEYALHVLRSWQLTITAGQQVTSFENQPYFEQIGVPSPRAAFPTGEGLLFLNNAKPKQPTVSILTIPPGSTNLTVVPISLSDKLDLSGYGFESCVVFRAGDYDIVECRESTNGLPNPYNSVTFIRNVYSEKWDKLDYTFSCIAEFDGGVISGDSLSVNLFELFSGFDDDGEVIENYYKTSFQNLDLDGLKKVGYIHVVGLIQLGQKLEIWYSLDNGDYVYLYTIDSAGPYVSTTDIVAIGTRMIGSAVIGGAAGNAPADVVFAGRYELDIPVHTDLFEYISIMVKAIDVGYVSVDRLAYKDIRFKRRRLLKYEDLEINNP